MPSDHVSARAYVLTFVGLLVLTSLTFALSFVHLGVLQMPVAMVIAIAKGVLVLLFFMHLIVARGSDRLVLAIAIVIASFLVLLAVTDVLTRTGVGVLPPLPNVPLPR